MKIKFFILFIVFMYPKYSHANWEIVASGINGNKYYVDFSRIRTNNNYKYYWTLSNYSKPSPQGVLSSKNYNQADCNQFRVRSIHSIYYFEEMGLGMGESLNDPNAE